MTILWHPNGVDRIEVTQYRLAAGFHEVWVPVDEPEEPGPLPILVACCASSEIPDPGEEEDDITTT